MAQQFPNVFFEEDTPHGLVKRIMYKKYLEAFIPITLRKGYSAVIIDGFAGAGRYGGEWPREIEKYGSPLIALMVALNIFYKEKTGKEKIWGKPKEENIEDNLADIINEMTLHERDPPEAKVTLYFIEEDRKNFEALKDNVAEVLSDFFPNPDAWLKESQQRDHYLFTLNHPSYPIQCKLFNGAFSSFNQETALERNRTKFLTFLDPFRSTHTPLVKVKQFLGNNKSVLIYLTIHSFMNRFACTDYEELLQFMEQTFNTKPDVPARHYASNVERYSVLYESILRKFFESCYSLSFEMRWERLDSMYHLIFACDDFSSLKAMKEVMNRCTQDDVNLIGYKFAKNYNCLYLSYSQDEESVADAIFKEFGGKQVKISEIKQFVWLETPFVFRKGPLSMMLKEQSPRLLQVTDGFTTPHRKGTFPDENDWLLTFDTRRPELKYLGKKIYEWFRHSTAPLSEIIYFAGRMGETTFRKTVLVDLMKENRPKIIKVVDENGSPPGIRYTFPGGREWFITFN